MLKKTLGSFPNMIEEILMFTVIVGVLSLLASIFRAISIFSKSRSTLMLSLIPALLIFFLGYVHFLYYLSQQSEIDQMTESVVFVFFVGGLLCFTVLTLMQKHTANPSKSILSIFYQNNPSPNLLNRKSLLQKLQSTCLKNNPEFAVLTLFINNFSCVQEVLGHEKTEKLLKKFALKLNKVTQDNIEIFHTQISSFGFIIQNVDINYLSSFSEELIESLERPIVIEKLGLTLTLNIGITLYPAQTTSAEDLLQHSEIAAYQAHRTLKPVVYYSKNLSSPFRNNAELLTQLQKAIKNEIFTLYYQRLTCIKNPNSLCFEVLIRWPIPNGFVSPAEFIPLAEQSNNIQAITRWVLAKAISQLEIWNRDNLDISLQINLSSKDIQDDKTLNYLTDLIAKHKVKPSQLTLEITETSMMQNVDRSREILAKIKELGIKLSIDDYGSGFSSLSILSEMPIDEIKIDRSFVAHLLSRKTHEAIVRSTINLAHSLGCEVVAEGVEYEDIANYLISIGCDKLQGYYFSKPTPLEQTIELIKKHREQQVVVA